MQRITLTSFVATFYSSSVYSRPRNDDDDETEGRKHDMICSRFLLSLITFFSYYSIFRNLKYLKYTAKFMYMCMYT